MLRRVSSVAAVFLAPVFCDLVVAQPTSPPASPGGAITFAERAEPKTFNPVTSQDSVSRDVLQLVMGDLVHINRRTLGTEPSVAESWEASPDRRRFVVRLRPGLRFSDGHTADADDVVFTFQVYLDPASASPQRDLLMVHGKPVDVKKQDSRTVVFTFAEPYAPGERLFDSIAILPRHLLQQAFDSGQIAKAWTLATPPAQIAGLGPFRIRQYVPGQRLTLERNPNYWKTSASGARLPGVDAVHILFVNGEDGQTLRFRAGETDLIARVGAKNFAALDRPGAPYRMEDLGPSLEFNFLMLNMNDLAGRKLDRIAAKQRFFRDLNFRQALSYAIDRDAITKLVYQGRGAPLWWHVSPGNRIWENKALPKPKRSVARAREILQNSGYKWDDRGQLRDSSGAQVEFTVLTSAGNADREQMATLLQSDLKEIGVSVTVVPMEFRALLDRVLNSWDYEACILGLGGGDADPGPEMNIWLSSGATHLWDLSHKQPDSEWQADLDRLMKEQLVTADFAARKRLFDRVQQIVAERLPIICLATPNVLVGAKRGLSGFQPGVLPPYAISNLEAVSWSRR